MLDETEAKWDRCGRFGRKGCYDIPYELLISHVVAIAQAKT